MANKRNKVKFGLSNVHWAKITQWGADADGTPTVPVYGESMRLPGAVSLSIDANGENENFYADDSVYYVINNNSGYEGDLEVALVTTEFATEILGEILDNNGVLVEKNTAEPSQFALMFEFSGVSTRSASTVLLHGKPTGHRSQTKEDSTEVKTETLTLTASALPTGLVKAKTCEATDESTYNNWYKMPYNPDTTAKTTTTKASS